MLAPSAVRTAPIALAMVCVALPANSSPTGRLPCSDTISEPESPPALNGAAVSETIKICQLEKCPAGGAVSDSTREVAVDDAAFGELRRSTALLDQQVESTCNWRESDSAVAFVE